jgi:hypothetical protein
MINDSTSGKWPRHFILRTEQQTGIEKLIQNLFGSKEEKEEKKEEIPEEKKEENKPGKGNKRNERKKQKGL